MNRVVVITGGTSGIGFATAKKFLSDGDVVILGSIDSREKTESALCDLKRRGEVYFHKLDIADENSCKEFIEYVKMNFSRIDVLVNAAGVRGRVSNPTETDFADLEKTIRINLIGNIRIATCVAREMKQQKSGVIINLGSISGELVTAEDYGYHCSKAAVAMASKVLAKEVSPYGVRCITLSPGGVKTGMNSSDWEQEGRKLHIRQKLISKQEAAGAIFLMAGQEASAINGSTVMMDDGYVAFKGIFE